MLGALSSRRVSCQSAADGDGFEDGPTHPCSLPAKLAEHAAVQHSAIVVGEGFRGRQHSEMDQDDPVFYLDRELYLS